MTNKVQIGNVYRYKRSVSPPVTYRQQNEYYENNDLFIMILRIHSSAPWETDTYDVLRWEMNKKNKTVQKTRSNFRVIHQFSDPTWWEEYLSCDKN